MAKMRRIVLSLLLFPLWAIGFPEGVEFEWSDLECQPGDVVELRAIGAFNELTSYELRLPQHDALHLVAHQRQPVHYQDGVYTQHDVWVLQPLYAGAIQLDEIRVIVRQGEIVREELRSVPALIVSTYGASADGQEAQVLPEPVASVESGMPVWSLLLIVVVPVCVCAFMLRKGRGESLIDAPESVSLETVRSSLAHGNVPAGDIEQLLADTSQSLTDQQRAALERAIYSRSVDAAALHAELDQEAAQ